MSYLDDPKKLEEIRQEYLKRLLKPKLTHERARIVTEAYRETEQDPPILKRAKSLRKVLSEMTIYLQPWELLAGNLGPEPVSAPLFPEGGVDFILDELDSYGTRDGDKFEVPAETKEELQKILPPWKGRALKDYGLALLPKEAVRRREAGVFSAENMLTCGTGHFIPDYRKILYWGFEALEDFARGKLKELSLTNGGDYEKRLFYEASLINIEGIRIFAGRYAKLVSSLAAAEKDAVRKTDLERIGRACERVPLKPAETFFEALQSIWIAHVACYIDSNGYGVTLGRIPEYLEPFYKDSLERGDITREAAVTLLVSFLFKTNDILKLYNNNAAKIYGGFPVGQPILLGGLGQDGKDTAGAVAELFLEAEAKVRLYQPDLAVLWNEKMSDDFFLKATRLVPRSSKPKYFNYHVGMDMFLEAGLPFEEARTNWGFIGCVEFGVPGKSWTWADAAMFNLAKCLELTLYGGFDPLSGELLGLPTGDPAKFSTFEAFAEAFTRQLNYLFDLTVQGITALQIAHRDLWPEPYESLLVEGCLESGKDANSGGARYYQTGVQFVGLATVADSLTAIKRLVFDTGRLSFADVLDALKKDFKGAEVLRARLLNDAPKFGNDDEEADKAAERVFNLCCDSVSKYKDIWGGIYTASFYCLTAHIGFGKRVGATPDGRRAFAPLSDASSPSSGSARSGATAIMKSQARLPHKRAVNGTLLNMKFNRKLLETEDGIKNLASLIKAGFRLGSFHAQFNVLEAETLKDAQKHPEKYPDFLVRVAAYVTNWNQLSKDVQDEIIARTELEGF